MIQVPRPQTTRGRWLARQRADDARGRFLERLLMFDFPFVPPGGTAQLVQTVPSMGGRFVRCMAIRGTTGASSVLGGSDLDYAQLFVRIQLHGDADFIGGNGTNFSSFASLFDDANTPWFWYLSPPLFRTGDTLTVTVINNLAGEGAPSLDPEIGFRLIDDDLWQELYTRDWRAEEEG